MQRYNEPAESTSPRSSRSLDILDSPSGRSSPRRSILRQPTTRADSPPRRGYLRQSTLLDSHSGSGDLSRDEDDLQLSGVYRTIRDFIREDVEFEMLEAEVNALQGHQDLKDMLPDNMDYIPGLRRLADMLELIQNKQDALDAMDELALSSAEPVAPEPIASAETESDDETESEPDSDDEPFVPPPRIARRVLFSSSDEDDEDDDIANADTVDVSAPLRF